MAQCSLHAKKNEETVYSLTTNVVEEQLKKGKLQLVEKVGKSDIWRDVGVVVKESIQMPFVACKKCLKVFRFRSRDTGTTHLKKHVQMCKKTSISISKNIYPLKKEIVKSAVELVAKDMRPTSIFDGDGMRAYSQCLINAGAKYGKLDASQVLPSRNTLDKALQHAAETNRENFISLLKQVIERNGGVAMTTDLWTDSHRKQSYISCTVQFIENDTVKQCTLFCEIFRPMTKTAENIKIELISILLKYGITNDVVRKHVVFVTDQAANVKKALESFHWLPCSCHILNAILLDAFKLKPDDHESTKNTETMFKNKEIFDIECVQKLLEEVNELVTYFKQSGLASKLSTSFVKECVMRWNTKLAVLESVHKVFPEIQSLLCEKNQKDRLTNIDVMLMEDVIQFLLPFKLISEAMEDDRYPTIHGVLLWKRKLLDHCKADFNDVPVIRILKRKVTDLISNKWPDTDFHKIALFLFPKFKSMSILHPSCVEHVHNLVRRMLRREDFIMSELKTNANHCYCSEQPPAKKNKGSHDKPYAWELSEYVDLPSDHDNSDEVSRYIAADFSFNDSASCQDHIGGCNVLKFWQEQKVSYPKLAKLARWILSIPASSTSSESVFSCTGRVNEEQRNQLSPDSIDGIVFLNSVFKTKGH